MTTTDTHSIIGKILWSAERGDEDVVAAVGLTQFGGGEADLLRYVMHEADLSGTVCFYGSACDEDCVFGESPDHPVVDVHLFRRDVVRLAVLVAKGLTVQ